MKPGNLSPAIEGTDLFHTVVDTPKGSRVKYKIDEKTGRLHLSKLLPLGAGFPYNFGFIPSTLGEDGDAIDVMLLMEEPVPPGTVVPTLIIGVLLADQRENKNAGVTANDRLLGVVKTRYNPPEFLSIEDVPQQRLKEIEHFFVSYNQAAGRIFTPKGRAGKQKAIELIEEGAKRYGISSQET